MNELSVEALIALYFATKIRVEINNGSITRMFIEGGN